MVGLLFFGIKRECVAPCGFVNPRIVVRVLYVCRYVLPTRLAQTSTPHFCFSFIFLYEYILIFSVSFYLFSCWSSFLIDDTWNQLNGWEITWNSRIWRNAYGNILIKNELVLDDRKIWKFSLIGVFSLKGKKSQLRLSSSTPIEKYFYCT